MAKTVFAAFSAGLSIVSRVKRNGFGIELNGFNEKLLLLVDIATKNLRSIAEECDESVFEMQRAEMKKNYGNAIQSTRNLNGDYLSKILRSDYWMDYEFYQHIDHVSPEHIQKFMQKIFRQMKIQILVQGNMTKSQAMEVVTILERNLSCEPLDTVSEIDLISLNKVLLTQPFNRNMN